MSRLRVLHFGKYYPPVRGGIETVVETLCRGEREAVDSQALVINRNGPTRSDIVDGVPVQRVGSIATIGAVSVAPMLPFWLARSSADVIVLHEPNPMALVAYWLARPVTPLVVWFHSEVIRPSGATGSSTGRSSSLRLVAHPGLSSPHRRCGTCPPSKAIARRRSSCRSG
jgi:rhamnosyl/mannosyltransferase